MLLMKKIEHMKKLNWGVRSFCCPKKSTKHTSLELIYSTNALYKSSVEVVETADNSDRGCYKL